MQQTTPGDSLVDNLFTFDATNGASGFNLKTDELSPEPFSDAFLQSEFLCLSSSVASRFGNLYE